MLSVPSTLLKRYLDTGQAAESSKTEGKPYDITHSSSAIKGLTEKQKLGMDAVRYARDARVVAKSGKVTTVHKGTKEPMVKFKDCYNALCDDGVSEDSSEKARLEYEMNAIHWKRLNGTKHLEGTSNLLIHDPIPIPWKQENFEDSVDKSTPGSYVSRRVCVCSHEVSCGLELAGSVKSGLIPSATSSTTRYLTKPLEEQLILHQSSPLSVPTVKCQTDAHVPLFFLDEDMLTSSNSSSDEEYNFKEDSPASSDSDSDVSISKKLRASEFGPEVQTIVNKYKKKMAEMNLQNKFLVKRNESLNDCLKFHGKI